MNEFGDINDFPEVGSINLIHTWAPYIDACDPKFLEKTHRHFTEKEKRIMAYLLEQMSTLPAYAKEYEAIKHLLLPLLVAVVTTTFGMMAEGEETLN